MVVQHPGIADMPGEMKPGFIIVSSLLQRRPLHGK